MGGVRWRVVARSGVPHVVYPVVFEVGRAHRGATETCWSRGEGTQARDARRSPGGREEERPSPPGWARPWLAGWFKWCGYVVLCLLCCSWSLSLGCCAVAVQSLLLLLSFRCRVDVVLSLSWSRRCYRVPVVVSTMPSLSCGCCPCCCCGGCRRPAAGVLGWLVAGG